MKLRSLFLASLAALAMVSCSNENDPIIDNGNGETPDMTALLELGFAFPKTAATRTTEAGDESEYEFSSIAIIMDYADSRVVKLLDRDDFSPAIAAANSQNVVIYTKQAIPVAVGEAVIRAIVNPTLSEEQLEAVTDYTDMSLIPTYESLNALTKSGMPANSGNFMMTSVTGGITKEFAENTTTTVQIPVTRVVAKLMETTAAEDRVFSNVPTDLTSATETQINSLKIELKKATYVNLAKTSSVFFTAPIATSWLNTYPADWATLPSNNGNFDYITLAENEKDNDIIYCFENGRSTPTGIIYEAEATWNGETAQTFYIAAGTLYLTYDALKDDFRDCPSATADAKTFHDAHIKKYEGGKCYYYKAINTTTENAEVVPEIHRNNVYKISVSNVLKIGNPTIIIEEDETLMNLSIEVAPWTVNENAFELD